MDLATLLFAVTALLLLLVMCGGVAMFFFTARTDDPATTLSSGLLTIAVDIVAAIFVFCQQLATLASALFEALPSVFAVSSGVAVLVILAELSTAYQASYFQVIKHGLITLAN